MAIGVAQLFSIGASILSGSSSNKAGKAAQRAFETSARALEMSADNVRQARTYNKQLDQLNFKRNLESLGRQRQITNGRQLAASAANNLGVTSKSFLALQTEAANTFDTMASRARIDQTNMNRMRDFEAEVTAVNLLNKAKTERMQGKAAREQGKSSQRRSFLSSIF